MRISTLMRVVAAAACLLLAPVIARSQPVEPPNGPRRVHPGWHALTDATVISAPGERLEHATILIRNGSIVAIGTDLAVPDGAREWSCTGMTIYPGLIDPYVTVETPAPDRSAPGAHWNARIHAERSVLDGEGLDAGQRERLRGMGFTIAGLAPDSGILRGRTAVVSLTDPMDDNEDVARPMAQDGFQAVALERGRFRDNSYPGSERGSIALLRQTLADVEWYSRATTMYARDPASVARPAPGDSLEALRSDAPLLFDVSNELDALRVAKIAREFGRRFAIVGSGSEYRRLEAIAGLGADLIIPVDFPEKPELKTPGDRDSITLRDLMSWEQAPTNLRRLQAAGASVSLTTGKLGDGQSFWTNLREAIRHGLSEDDALAMMTTRPAALLGIDSVAGRIAPGYAANLLVVDDGALFDKERTLRAVWVDGRRYELEAEREPDLAGTWAATIDLPAATIDATLSISEKHALTLKRPAPPDAEEDAPEADAPADDADADADQPEGDAAADKDEGPKMKPVRLRNSVVNENRISFLVNAKDLDAGEGTIMFAAVIEGDDIHGEGVMPDGTRLTWSATRQPDDDAKADDAADDDADADDADGEDKDGDEDKDDDKDDNADLADIPESWGVPFGAFGYESVPEQQEVVFVNATIWTCGPDGVIENGALHVRKGRIVQVGPASRLAGIHGATRIDLGGMHITPGLIDCHSHTGISGGVNEGTQSVTAEVRIFDVIDPDDINWYRELAGGLTAANQLHGSANAIGGQNSVVKIRWGCAVPDDMRVEGAPGGIKFALGENVKQSNWGEEFTSRYPQTRMGVEAIIRDRFTAAREYAAAWKTWNNLGPAAQREQMPPRRDLELEALAEILAGDRLIHCHSYRQDEILMLCRVAEDFGF
ncbi:MAG: amidohydrolase family protein, partial [Phycisphaerales bacterium]|nr:amidohydrolase family protein [Phycisphaerales bacterium]